MKNAKIACVNPKEKEEDLCLDKTSWLKNWLTACMPSNYIQQNVVPEKSSEEIWRPNFKTYGI
jgi:hypothetical protein